MYKIFFYLLTFLLVGLIGCEKAETTEVLTGYSAENLRKFGALPMQTSGLCCSDDLPIILDIDSTPFSGNIGTYSCNHDIISVDWTVTNSNNNHLASGNNLQYVNSFLLEYNVTYAINITAVLEAPDGTTKSESAIFEFIYSNGSFSVYGKTQEGSLCTGDLGGIISAIMP